MSPRIMFAVGAMVLMIAAGGCAPATANVRIERGRTPPATRLADVRLEPGTRVLVRLVAGDTVRGSVRGLSPDRLNLLVERVQESPGVVRSIAEPEIQTIARLPRLTPHGRSWLGAAIGAAATLPFSISMFGDMIVPGAIAGGVIGSRSGDTRAEIVFERTAPGANGPRSTGAASRVWPAAPSDPTDRGGT